MRVAFLVAWACLCALGCQAADGPDLLTVSELGPGFVAAGDRIDVRGEGFPQGRQATVVFRGELRRPGTQPVDDVEISAAAFAHTATQVTIAIDEAIARRFVGSGEGAEHTTFHGDVRVIFAARAATAPAVVGTLRGVTLDVIPPEPGSEVARHEDQGRQFLAHLGVVASRGGPQAPLAATAVLPGGLADRLGLREGDILASLSGVTVRSVADLAVPRGMRSAVLWVRRGESAEPFRVEFDVSALTTPSPSDLAPAAVLLGVLVLLVLLLAGPLPRLAAWFERALWLCGTGRASRRLRAEHVLEWLSPSRAAGGVRGVLAPLAAFIGVVSVFTYIGFGKSLLTPESDLGVVYGASSAALLAGRLVEGGRREGRSWSLGLGLLAVVQTLVVLAPGALGLGALVVSAESITLADIARAQGGAPWRWWGLDNPGLALCALGLLLSAVPTGARNRLRFAVLEGVQVIEQPSILAGVARTSEWVHAWTTAALAASLYFGGWQIPLASAVWEPSIGIQAVGAALFVLKLWVLMIGVVAGRALTARLGVASLIDVYAFGVLPMVLMCGAGAIVWAEGVTRFELPGATVGALAVTVVLGMTGYLFVRYTVSSSRDALAGSVNPWL